MKIVIIGCGSIGYRHLINLNANFDCEIAIHDSDIKKIEEISKNITVKIVSNIEDASKWGAEAAIVASPNSSHISYATQLLKYNIPCLIEKPISNNLQEAELFIKQADENNYPVFVACNMRFHPGPTTIKKYLNKIGRPIFFDAYFSHYLPYMRPDIDYKEIYFAESSEAGGVIFDSIHEIDYVSWLAGKISKVNSSYYSKLSDLQLNTEDYAVFSLSHENNISSCIRLDYISKYKMRGCKVIGSEGNLIWESVGKSPEKCIIKYCHRDVGEEVLYENDNLDLNQAYIDMLLDFIKSIQGESKKKLLTGKKALDVLNTAIRVKNTMNENKTA